MTTKFLTIKFAKIPNFIVMELLRKKTIFCKFPPPDPQPKRKFY